MTLIKPESPSKHTLRKSSLVGANTPHLEPGLKNAKSNTFSAAQRVLPHPLPLWTK